MGEEISQIRYLCLKLVNHKLNFLMKIIFPYSQLLPLSKTVIHQSAHFGGVGSGVLEDLACHL